MIFGLMVFIFLAFQFRPSVPASQKVIFKIKLLIEKKQRKQQFYD